MRNSSQIHISLPTFHPGRDAPEIQYMHERRKELGGYLPERRTKYVNFELPSDMAYASPRKGSGSQEIATTMSFVRMLKDLLKAEGFGKRISMIIPDEARTFGMDAFSQQPRSTIQTVRIIISRP